MLSMGPGGAGSVQCFRCDVHLLLHICYPRRRALPRLRCQRWLHKCGMHATHAHAIDKQHAACMCAAHMQHACSMRATCVQHACNMHATTPNTRGNMPWHLRHPSVVWLFRNLRLPNVCYIHTPNSDINRYVHHAWLGRERDVGPGRVF